MFLPRRSRKRLPQLCRFCKAGAASVGDGIGPLLLAHLLDALFQHVHGNVGFFFGDDQRRSPTRDLQCTAKCRTIIQEHKMPQAAYATKRSARLDARVSPKEKELIEAAAGLRGISVTDFLRTAVTDD